MKYKFDFSLDLWIQNVEINAESPEEAKELFNELMRERLVDMLEDAYIKDFAVKDLEIEEEEEETAEDIWKDWDL